MGPPVAVGPGKKFRVSHPLSGPDSVGLNDVLQRCENASNINKTRARH